MGVGKEEEEEGRGGRGERRKGGELCARKEKGREDN